MRELRINGYLSDTVTNVKHPQAVKLKTRLEDLARSNNAEVKSFEVTNNGVALVEFSNEELIEKVIQEFEGLSNVKVEALSAFQVEFELNRDHQQSIDKKRAAKAAKKKKQADQAE
jgi:hypothetical protein